jgi:hypothetical protein
MLNKAKIDKVREEAIAWAEIEFRNVDEFSRNDLELCVKSFIAARATTPPAPVCLHRVADIRNPVVKSGYMCIDCGSLFSAADHDIAPHAPAPSTLAEQVAHAKEVMATWSPELRASVRLEGGDGAAPADDVREALLAAKDGLKRSEPMHSRAFSSDERQRQHQLARDLVDKALEALAAVPRQAAVADDTARMDYIEKHAIIGATYKGITSANVIVHGDEWNKLGLRTALDAAMARDALNLTRAFKRADRPVKEVLDAPYCGCTKCLDASGKTVEVFGMQIPVSGMMMVLCATCGNKRCPHAADHELACTDSNEPGQPGSNYPAFVPPEPPQ